MLTKEEREQCKLGLTIFLAGFALICFYLSKDVVGIFLLAAVISIAIHPFIVWAEGKKIPGFIAITVAYSICGLMLVLLFIELVPLVIDRLTILFQELPPAVGRITNSISKFASNRNMNLLLEDKMSDYLNQAANFLTSTVVNFTKDTFSLFITLIFVFFISAYLALDSKSIKEGFLDYFPKEDHSSINIKIHKFNDAVKRSFYGKIVVSVILGVTILIGLWVLKVEKFISISLLAFLLNFIPFVGSAIATIIAVLIGLSQSLFMGIAVLFLFLMANFIESNFTTPYFIGRESNLHPVLVLLAIGIGGCVWGLLGVVVSIPLASAIVSITKANNENS